MAVGCRTVPWPLVAVALAAAAVFVALTILVTSNTSLALDSRAFEIANDLRAPWLDSVARVVTTMGVIAIVGPAVLIGAALLIWQRQRARAAALVVGSALTLVSVSVIKTIIDRPRPPAPLVHTSGHGFPSGHATNSVGWTALAIALTVAIPNRGARIAAIVAGALLTVLVGLSRIQLRAHYASDVLAGEALAVTMYAFAAIGVLVWQTRRAGGSAW